MLSVCYNNLYRLLSAVQDLTEEIPVNVGETVVIVQETFAVSVQEVEPDTFEREGGQTISANLGTGGSISLNKTSNSMRPPTASVSLPSNLFRRANGTNSTRIVSNVYLNDALFLRRDSNNFDVNSIILSAGVAGVSRVLGLDPPVTLEFARNEVRDVLYTIKCS